MGRTFSENWHRVANVRARLRPAVSVRRQSYRGEEWYVVHAPFTDAFFRLTPAYYLFLSRLDFSRTIEEAWLGALEEDPEHGPGQEDVISLLMELSQANLIHFDKESDAAKLFEQNDEKERMARRRKWMNILFIRFGLFNPDRLLTALGPLWKALISIHGALVWLAVTCWGVLTALQHAGEIAYAASSVLEPSNLIPLYAGLVLLKVFHETGHAAVCKRFGGNVSSVGVMFLFFAPLPYVDATSSWAMEEKWKRILVSSAGILVELFLGSLCCVIWAWSPPGMLHTIAYNMMFTATVSTLLFNANPLMRFDGYYILVDLLEMPNIYQRSREHVIRLCEKYILGVRGIQHQHIAPGEEFWLTLYGVSSSVYRIFLVLGISLFLADNYFFIGLIFGSVMIASSCIKPVLSCIKYLFRSSALRGVRARAIGKVSVLVGLLALFVFLVPLPYDIVAPGVVESCDVTNVIADSAGQVAEFCAEPGERVEKGQVLLRQSNPAIDYDIRKAKAQLQQIAILGQQALSRMGLDRNPVEKRRLALEQLLSQLEARKRDLVIRAACSGVWGLPDAEALRGQWIAKGRNLGRIVSSDNFLFKAVIVQEDASSLFDGKVLSMAVRLKGVDDADFKVENWSLLAHYQEELPSAALGWRGGGDIPLSPWDDSGLLAAEPFYLLEADLDGLCSPATLEGRTGAVRIDMASRTLAERTVLYCRQFLQKRYQL
ncbi:MAG: site-2 protease family protein [Desulfovibrionaceae bacterium]